MSLCMHAWAAVQQARKCAPEPPTLAILNGHIGWPERGQLELALPAVHEALEAAERCHFVLDVGLQQALGVALVHGVLRGSEVRTCWWCFLAQISEPPPGLSV